ncbi:MAG: NO-inducible flavohemoprotein [Methylophilaceae bacterium]
MLSAAARPYIDASVPVLRDHGLAITGTFYRNLFGAHPELKNLFNMGNQAQGTQQQSLAAAVFAYAANIDNAEVLAPVISRIVHKHASLGIKAELYPIVGHHLVGAIKETLGDAATAPLLDAWAEAYSLLADALVAEEQKLYSDAGTAAGELRELQVTQIRQESEHVRSFVLNPTDGKPLPIFHPGQYISVAVTFPDGTRQLRQYSLSDAPGRPHLRISVKRELARDGSPSGQVSNWLHDNVRVNDRIQVGQPFGDFRPDIAVDDPLVLISAGVGITPMISTLNQLALTRPEHQVIFAHAARSRSHHSHTSDLEGAIDSMPNLKVITFYESPHASERLNENTIKGEMQLSSLAQWPRETANVYLCGPLGFMNKQWRELLDAGVPRDRLHREVFGPDMLENLI